MHTLFRDEGNSVGVCRCCPISIETNLIGRFWKQKKKNIDGGDDNDIDYNDNAWKQKKGITSIAKKVSQLWMIY